ncbi:hypothetical protein BDS110ZK25_17550 [Bradyrhizobium diazoefficiens]
MFGGQRHLGSARIGDGSSHLARENLREQLQPLEEQTMNSVEQRRSVSRRCHGPASEGSSGGGYGAVHIIVIAKRNLGDRLLRRRIDDGRCCRD